MTAHNVFCFVVMEYIYGEMIELRRSIKKMIGRVRLGNVDQHHQPVIIIINSIINTQINVVDVWLPSIGSISKLGARQDEITLCLIKANKSGLD